jgi:Domain of unknown function (DUF2017)
VGHDAEGDVNGWKRSGRGTRVRLVGSFDARETSVLRGLLTEVRQMLAGRSADHPADELAVLTGIRTGPATRPNDRVLARLLPDFTAEDADLAAGLRSLHEPELIEAKDRAAAAVLDALPVGGGRVELRPADADTWRSTTSGWRWAPRWTSARTCPTPSPTTPAPRTWRSTSG